MDNVFIYPITLLDDQDSSPLLASWTTNLLPLTPSDVQANVLYVQLGQNEPGMYFWTGRSWVPVIPYERICESVIDGGHITIVRNNQVPIDFAQSRAQVSIYRNGVSFPGTVVRAEPGVTWAAVVESEGGSVASVNNIQPDGQGNITVRLQDLPDVQFTPGEAIDGYVMTYDSTSGKWVARAEGVAAGTVTSVSSQHPDPSGNVVIQAQDNNGATGTSLITDGGATTGTIKLKTLVPGNLISLTPDVNGNIVVSSSATAGALTAVNSEGTGTSLVDNNGTAGGIATIKSLAAGSNVTITPSGDGKTLTVAANQVISPATTTTIGGVIIGAGINVDGTGKISLAPPSGVNLGGVKAGTGISIATDGTISATNAGAISSVTNEGTGVGLVDNDGTSGGVATIKSLAAGSNVSITPSGDGKTLTIAANQTLNPATTTTIGGVIVGSGLSVDGTGKIALAAPSGVNLGGVKAGSGITIAEDGTISATGGGAVTSVSGQTGDVVISTVDNNPATGSHSLISNTGATTGTAKLRTLVAGTGVTITNDGNDNLLISSTASGGVTSIATDTSGALTGAITLSAGPSISMSNVGNMIQISGTGVPEAPNDGNGYMRQNLSWAVVPDVANAITSVTGQDGTGAVILVESNPPANSAIIKSLVAGQNISFSEDSGLITVSASIPAGTVATVNGISPNGSGNVTLTAANVNAVPIAGGVTMTGPLNFGSQVVTGIPTPANPSDAVPLSYITALTIDQGTF